MKEINVIINSNDLLRVTDILLRYKVGLTFFDVEGTGRTPRSTLEMVDSYQTNRSIIPKFIEKKLIISIVPDSIVNLIVDEILNCFDDRKEAFGVLFVKDVSKAYELGTKIIGDEVLYAK